MALTQVWDASSVLLLEYLGVYPHMVDQAIAEVDVWHVVDFSGALSNRFHYYVRQVVSIELKYVSIIVGTLSEDTDIKAPQMILN